MLKDTAGSSIWTIGKLVQAVQAIADSGVRVEIPKFQRRLVWKDQQRIDLIDSIHRGYPIGSILLYRRPNPGGQHETYQVVDGLQRTSTLIGYSEQPLTYASSKLLSAPHISGIAHLIERDSLHVERAIQDWMRATKKLTFAAGFSPHNLAAFVFDALDVLPSKRSAELDVLIEEALDELKVAVDITAVSLPVVTYAGPEGELPEIFERINQSGTKLNKYEVFAATWMSNSQTQVNSTDVRVAINDKYDALISRGFAISDLDSGRAIQDFNLFEYLFGFGKCLVRGHSLLFNQRSDPAETEPAAFSLSCVVRGQQLSRMALLPEFMPRAEDGIIDPAEMEACLTAAATEVQRWLAPFVGLRLNNTSDGIDIAHGELQIVSIIARTAAGRWDTRGDWSERPNWEADWKRLALAVPQHYLMDAIEETWRGPIYSTLFSRVWEMDDDGRAIDPSPYYSRPIERRTWENALDTWFGKQLEREQRSRQYVRAVDRLLLRFVYAGLVSFKDDKKHQFELEHLYPVSRLKRVIVSSEGPGWPISCIANLALFTKILNREKSEQTISEYLSAHQLSKEERAVLDRLLLCRAEDVDISEPGLTLEAYRSFLRGRWSTMKDALYRNLEIQAAQSA
ncbi:DUF262 domain-containing protein [Pseudactinotalea terrae]|uniref:DUF262 domain-containing protein n=1 Tax=Pseudactinotalea terrae TaxID=1743262 RepID=UPI001390EF86|nr:DUF262 domain-containing protein [Pseudactinotalea terrae]